MSNVRLVLASGARKDIKNAYDWYNAEGGNAATQFSLAIEKVLSRVGKSPQIYPISYGTFRRMLIPDFPYALFYKVTTQQIVIHAVLHTSRGPDKIHKRLI